MHTVEFCPGERARLIGNASPSVPTWVRSATGDTRFRGYDKGFGFSLVPMLCVGMHT